MNAALRFINSGAALLLVAGSLLLIVWQPLAVATLLVGFFAGKQTALAMEAAKPTRREAGSARKGESATAKPEHPKGVSMNNNPPNPTPSVTEEMIEAGEKAWREWEDSNHGFTLGECVQFIFLAMRAAEQKGTGDGKGA